MLLEGLFVVALVPFSVLFILKYFAHWLFMLKTKTERTRYLTIIWNV